VSDEESDLHKIACLLALLVTKELPKSPTALTLNSCGFTNREIAALTGSSEGSVRAMISQGRRKQGTDA
jgi:DNA-directed RNA polymerase specialized sigma24 family protein